jgi:hypothetical protein
MRYVVLVAAVLCAGVVLAEEVATDGARGAAFQFAKHAITRTLNNPSSADFDWESVEVRLAKRLRLDANAAPTEIVAVQGIVRATNLFNAVVSQKYVVYMKHEDDLWQPIMVMLENDNVFLTVDGKKLLALIDQEQEKRRAAGMAELQRQSKEQKQKEEQQKRTIAAYDAGRAAFAPAFARERRSLTTAKKAGVEKLAEKYAAKSDACDNDEEKEAFVKGFLRAFSDAQKNASAK